MTQLYRSPYLWAGVAYDSGLAGHRFVRYASATSIAYATSGQDADGVIGTCGGNTAQGEIPGPVVGAVPGLVFLVQLGGSVSSGGQLQVGSSGHAVAHSSGVAVARALESGTSGDVILAVWLSGRS